MSRLAFAATLLLLTTRLFATVSHPVPRERPSSAADWFPYVFSKVAPLEEWNAILSPDDIVRDRYSSDAAFQSAKQDTYVIPRFCFSFFRADPKLYEQLAAAIETYRGAAVWQQYGNCLGAFTGKLTFYPPLSSDPELLKKFRAGEQKVPQPDPDFVAKAVADIPRFCQYIETQLDLVLKTSQDFDDRSLTPERLATTPPLFDDFVEWGDFTPFFRPASGQNGGAPLRHPSFGVGEHQMWDLLGELGAKESASGNTNEFVAIDYPLLSQLNDVTMGAVYKREEIPALLVEIARAQTVVKKAPSFRALDNLYRLARWAERDHAGIYFPSE